MKVSGNFSDKQLHCMITTKASFIACHECDLLQREIQLLPGGVARCARCGAKLYRVEHRSIEHTLALTPAAA